MRLQVSISNQAYIFLWSIIGGMFIAFVFDVFRIKRKTVKTSDFVIFIEDFLYWIIAALSMFAMVYYTNDGELRGYIFAGTVLGATIYIVLLSRIVIKISLKLIWIIGKISMILWNILSYPFKFIMRILSIPGVIVYNFICRKIRQLRRLNRRNIEKMSIWRRIFNNARKKI